METLEAVTGTIIIVQADNNGVAVDVAVKNGWLAEIARKFGGYTEISGYGGWLDADGTLYQEANWIISTDVPVSDIGALKDYLLRLAERVKIVLDQKSVYVKIGATVYFV